jgi:hypothetical protein
MENDLNEIKRYIVLDLHGIIYANDSDFGIKKSGQKYLSEFQSSKFSSVYAELEEMFFARLNTELAEYKDKQAENIYFFPSAIKAKDLLFELGNKLIVFSSSGAKTIKYIVEKFVAENSKGYLLKDVDVYDARFYGDKREASTWKKIFEKYPRIDYVFDDKIVNLHAAQTAAEELGYKPELLQSLNNFTFN